MERELTPKSLFHEHSTPFLAHEQGRRIRELTPKSLFAQPERRIAKYADDRVAIEQQQRRELTPKSFAQPERRIAKNVDDGVCPFSTIAPPGGALVQTEVD